VRARRDEVRVERPHRLPRGLKIGRRSRRR
jgi:hypothetical protein